MNAVTLFLATAKKNPKQITASVVKVTWPNYGIKTGGGTDDVMRLVDCLERADIQWRAIGGIAVNHWADEPMVTQDVYLVIATESIEEAVRILEEVGFTSERFAWSIKKTEQKTEGFRRYCKAY